MPVNRNLTSRLSIAALAVFAASSSGCGWFHQKADYYSKAPENRPLEVPPDLDTPVTTSELLVPGSPTSGPQRTPAASNVSTVPPAAADTATAASAAPSATFSGSDLRVTDSVAHTWQRVGIALERAQIGTLSARDENAHTYTLDFASTTEIAETEHHWYSRILHPFGGSGTKTQQVTSQLTVRVSDDNGGARVSVEGNSTDKSSSDAARRVVQVLRDRLS